MDLHVHLNVEPGNTRLFQEGQNQGMTDVDFEQYSMTWHGPCGNMNSINQQSSCHHAIHVKSRHRAYQLRRAKELLLIRDEQTRNRRTGKSTNRTSEHRADCNPGYITTATGRDLRQYTDLVTQRADVGESTEGVGGDQARAI